MIEVGTVVRVKYPEYFMHHRNATYRYHMSEYVPEGSTGVVVEMPSHARTSDMQLYRVKFFSFPEQYFLLQDKWFEVIS